MALADLVNISGLVIALFSLWGLIWQILRTEGMEVEEGIYFRHDKRYISSTECYHFFYSIESVNKSLMNCRIVDRFYSRGDGSSFGDPEVRQVGVLREGEVRQYAASAPMGTECAIVVRYSVVSKIRKRIIERAVMFKVTPCSDDGRLKVTRYWWKWNRGVYIRQVINAKLNKKLSIGRWVRMNGSCESELPMNSYYIP